jgi:hypothetical protein
LLRLKWQAAALRFEMALGRHDRALKYGYHPDQPRVPARNPNGGQWTSEAGAGSSGGKQPARTAQAGFGVLVAEIPLARGRNWVYNFGNFSVVVPGPINFSCPSTSPLAGTTHGTLLNDNRPSSRR